jgi:hypothetical protein
MFTLLSLDDLVLLMQKRSDLYIVTDLKDNRYRWGLSCRWFWMEFVSRFQAVDEKILLRVIPAVFNLETYDILTGVWDFSLISLDLYPCPNSHSEIVDYVAIKAPDRLKMITMDYRRMKKNLDFVQGVRRAGVMVFVHSDFDVDINPAERFRSNFSGWYSWDLPPSPAIAASFPGDG